MKKESHKKGLGKLLMVCALMGCLMLSTAAFSSSGVGGVVNLLLMPMQRVSAALSEQMTANAEETAASKEDLLSENKDLKAQINDLNRQLINYDTLKRENEEYKKYLGLKEENQDYQLLAAEVIAKDPDDLYGSITIDQGSRDGVSKNDPVITDAGLLGWVSEVFPTSSRVTTLFHADAKFGARDSQTQETGIMSCTVQSADEGYLRMNYLDSTTKVQEGDLIVTSGLAVESGFGGLFPRNLTVGTVKSVSRSESDASLYALVQPAVDLKNPKDVMVITNFAGKSAAGEDTASSGGNS